MKAKVCLLLAEYFRLKALVVMMLNISTKHYHMLHTKMHDKPNKKAVKRMEKYYE